MSGARLFHLHIPKTAGTSLRSAFKNNKYKVFSVNSNFAYDAAQHEDVDLFSGHAGYRAVEASPELSANVVTILRDPFDRVASYYYHLVKLHRGGHENSNRTNLAAKYGLLEFLAIKDDPHLLTDLYNTATWQLVYEVDVHARMTYRRDEAAFSDADLVERAKANLAACLVVGFQDRLEEFSDNLKRATGFSAKLGAENVNTERVSLDTLDAPARRRIGEWIELDLVVYEWARANLGQRFSDPPAIA